MHDLAHDLAANALTPPPRFQILSHPQLLEHATAYSSPLGSSSSYPESPERLQSVLQSLQQGPASRALDVTCTRVAQWSELAWTHTADYLAKIQPLEGLTGEFLPETLFSPHSVEAARRAVGLGLELLDRWLSQQLEGGFALVRPPGHHATATAGGGYCIFNTLGVVAHAALRQGVRRILVLDWDVHHGNGTQSLFYADPRVLFIDWHQENLFPENSGRLEEQGVGEGRGFTINFPMPHSCQDNDYLFLFDQGVAPQAREFDPELILVSCGLDAHEADPLGSMRLTTQGFTQLSGRLRKLQRQLPLKKACQNPQQPGVLFFLEGGYEVSDLAKNVAAVIAPFLTQPTPAASGHAPDHLLTASDLQAAADNDDENHNAKAIDPQQVREEVKLLLKRVQAQRAS